MARTYRKGWQHVTGFKKNTGFSATDDYWDEYWGRHGRGMKPVTRRKQRRAFNSYDEEFLYED